MYVCIYLYIVCEYVQTRKYKQQLYVGKAKNPISSFIKNTQHLNFTITSFCMFTYEQVLHTGRVPGRQTQFKYGHARFVESVFIPR